MRLSGLIPVVFSIVALVLSLLCLLAGRKPGFMESYSIITLNTSHIGEFALNKSSESSKLFDHLPSSIQNKVTGILDNTTGDLAQALGVHDFYSAHILTYCEGVYTPNDTDPKVDKKNVTKCSNTTAMFTFDPTTILQSELPSDVSLSDLNWPQDVDNGFRALRDLSRAVFVLYVIGIVVTGLALLTALVTVFFGGRVMVAVNIFWAFLAFLALGIASAIITSIMNRAAHIINKYGADIGVAAYRGTKFLALTWVATALMLLASLVWCFECCVPSRRRRDQSPRKYG